MDQAVIDIVAREIGVDNLVRLREGGQKYVAKGRAAHGDTVLKIVSLVGVGNAEELLRRATREVELLSDVDHPNIVRIQQPLTAIGDPIVAVAWLEEYLDGEDLTDRLGVPWSWSDVRAFGLDLARGLQVLHQRSVVHRDLSPNNVRCLRRGSYVLMDPGYARHLSRSTLTVFGQPGTPGYLSPEHLSQNGPMPASDVFCVGILMFAALTGDIPFALTADMAAYQIALRTQPATSIRVLRPDIPADAASVIDRCLDLQPARRFLDGGELAAAIEGVSA